MSTASVSFDQTRQDILDMQLHFYRHGKYRVSVLQPALIPFLSSCWAALVTLFCVAGGRRDGVLIFGTSAVVFALVAVVVLVRIWRLPEAWTKKWLADPQLRLRLLGPQTVSVSPDGIHWCHPAGEGRAAWPGVSRVERGARGLYVYIGPASTIGIPARALMPPEEFERFASLAEQYINQARGAPTVAA